MGEKPKLLGQIAQIAARQHGNITRDQLLALQVNRRSVDYWLATGRLFRLHRGVYAVGHPPTDPIQRAAAAVMACGPRAVLSHGSAMTLHGFWQRWDRPFEITLAGDRRRHGICIHRCSTLLRRDVTVVQNIRVTSAARTALDMAPRLRPKSLTRLINDARRPPVRLTLTELVDVADRNPSHPGAPLVRWHIEDPHNPTRSGGEDDFPGFCRRYDLPIPLINTKVHGFEVDAYFPAERLIVELDGWPFHRNRGSFESDRDRDATMLAHDIPTLRITYERLEQTPDREAARLHSILRQRRPAA
jgi:hypothetical protein